jgi:hypothetical protein
MVYKAVDWKELGFVCDNRFIFAQKSLENCVLPKSFEKYITKIIRRKIMSKKTIYRSAITGKFVKKAYAEKHPNTTEKERVNVETKKDDKK